MADEQENIKLNFDSNAKTVAGDVNKLSASIESTTASTNENNQAVEQGNQSYKTFKTQLREANQELQKSIQLYGETSAETVKAAKAVAELKDQMGFAKDLSEQFNPDQKMKALGAATQVAGTGLQGVTAGMALFGDQSKDTQAQLLKVQAAMAFSDALSNLSNIGDQFSILKTTVTDVWKSLTTVKTLDSAATAVNTGAVVANTGAVVAETTAVTGSTVATTAATIATNIWNASLAVALAPITLIVAGIAALVLGIGYLTGAFGDFSGEQLKAEVANKKMSNSIEAQERAFKKNNEQLELSQSRTLGLAKAQGQSVEQIQKLENALINQEVAEKRLNAVKLQSIFIEASRISGLEDATDSQKKTTEKAWEAFKKANENYNDSLTERKKIAINHEIEMASEKKQADDRAAEKAKERREKAQEEAKKASEKAKEDAIKEKEYYIKRANEFEEAQAEIEFNKKQKEKEDKEKEYNDGLQAQADKAKTESDIANNAAEEKKRREEVIFQQEEVIQNAKLSLANQAVNLFGQIFGKSKKAQKASLLASNAVGLAEVVINTQKAVSADIAVPFGAGLPKVPIDIASGSLGAASIIAATARGLKELGGGSVGNAPSFGSTTAASAPPTVAFNNTAENQIGQSVALKATEQPPLKVYVAESDISNAQNNVKVLVKKNTF
jgi:hypothetical protein